MKRLFGPLIAASLMSVSPLASAQDDAPAPLEVEDSDTLALPDVSPHWIITEDNWAGGANRIFDGETGKMLGQLHITQLASTAADPAGRYFYTAETVWTKHNRGTRQDYLTVRDAKTLKVLREISLPGRLLVGNRKNLVGISGDGRHAFVYNMDPANSIAVVGLGAGRVTKTVEVPGCSLVTGFGKDGGITLCSDGTAGLVSVGQRKEPVVTTSEAFFSAENDPVFDNFAVNALTAEAVFLTYSGKVVSASNKGTLKLGEPWSLQEAAGYPVGTTAPLNVNWYPGGRQPLAYNSRADRLFVLMHMGEFWSQKVPGQEIWVFEASTRKLLKRVKLPGSITDLAVSQDAAPLLFLGSEGTLFVWDALTLEPKHEIEEAGHGMLLVPAVGP